MVRAVVLAESPIGTLTLRIRSTFFVACLWVGHILSNRDHVRFCAICLSTNNVKFNPIEDASRAILCRAIELRTFLGFFLGRTVDLATALVLAILPDAIVLVGPDITWNLKEFKFNAGVGGLVVKGDTRADVWTSLRKSLVKPCKAIFTTGPLGEREVPSFFIVGSLADVGTILFIVHPLVGIGCVRQTAMKVLDLDFIAWIDRQAWRAFFIPAKLEFCRPDILAQLGFRVLATVESQIVLRPSSEEVAFSCMRLVALLQRKSA